ncbi:MULTISPECIES: hypothetical protein [unclassified Sphingomonas]|jgi:hypothetical protein|uniref:hypothetical protein n=1 Tax=unclassified Sphingomonas TaxID=196159 RepID=UPI000831B943|nr:MULTISPECIES: hypothetical protein [unclassified Sphingomonas]
MTDPHDPGPDEGRGVAGRLVYDPSFAAVTEEEFNELVALMRDGPARKPLTPEAQWRRDYHAAIFNRRLVGVQHDLFGAKPTTHMHKAKPGPVCDWQPEPVAEKLARIARDPNTTFGIGRPALSEDEKAAVIRGAANWLRIGQRVRIVGSFASYDGRAERRVGRIGVIWRLCSPVFADHTYVYLDPVGAERTDKVALVELRDVEPIDDALLVPVPFPG